MNLCDYKSVNVTWMNYEIYINGFVKCERSAKETVASL